MRVIPTRSQDFAPVGRDKEPEVISRLAVMAVCGSQDREEKREILSISGVSGGWRHGIRKELKGKGTLCQVEEEGAAEGVWILRGEVGSLRRKATSL